MAWIKQLKAVEKYYRGDYQATECLPETGEILRYYERFFRGLEICYWMI